jgi:hypothetical protein
VRLPGRGGSHAAPAVLRLRCRATRTGWCVAMQEAVGQNGLVPPSASPSRTSLALEHLLPGCDRRTASCLFVRTAAATTVRETTARRRG